ncbi:hypothetical protein [Janthinobacterium sp.]|uniref:hypothetical protein n=1 Tax=Janthinobacterium sp. TaxID=1871054 RepID=UPI0026255F91|nr:hypothetical protein [Janthinobacterium sp.]
METKVVLLALSVMVAGCAVTAPPITNLSGKPIKFSQPVLEKVHRETAKFVLLEKSIADGRFAVVSISAVRQPITNARQERIAFNSDLTSFAPDYADSSFRTYVDDGNYGQKTVITDCGLASPKTQMYSPCDSEFGEVFVPASVTKAYVAGSMNAYSMKAWNDPARNRMRYVVSPQHALVQAGVFQRLAELAAVK